jgi:hypothetical protein
MSLPSLSSRSGLLRLLALLAIAAGVRLWLGPHPADDAYITFRYARNLAAGAGFVYNPGEPVLGTSTPLFTLLLAAAAWCGAGIPETAFALGILGDLLVITAVHRALRRSGLPLAADIAGLLLAALPLYVFHSLSGMETSLYAGLLALAVDAYAAARMSWASLWLGLAAVTRPEGFLLAAVLGGHRLWTRKRLTLREMAPFVLVVAPWLVYAWHAFGSPVPQSVRAKAAVHGGDWRSSLANWLSFFGGTSSHRALSLCALAGLALAARGRAWLWLWAFWTAVVSALFIAGGAFNYEVWYYAPLLPPYLALAACGLGGVLAAAGRAALRLPLPHPRLLGATALALLAAAGLGVLLPRLAADRAAALAQSREREDLYRDAALSLPRGAAPLPLLAASEIGVLGYYYPGPILDLVGLVSPQAVGHSDRDKIAAARPAWIVSYDSHLDPALLRSPELAREYELVRSVTISPRRRLLVLRRRPLDG